MIHASRSSAACFSLFRSGGPAMMSEASEQTMLVVSAALSVFLLLSSFPLFPFLVR
jgi:hypothetical protein